MLKNVSIRFGVCYETTKDKNINKIGLCGTNEKN